MFIRNIGKSYDLAILDTHVLKFMDIQNLLNIKTTRLGSVQAYERVEKIVVDYANRFGYPVGFLDWAIWATMKAALELGI
jgi:N-glycosylase/DNA lyase